MNQRLIDTRVFKILSYILFFWLIGLFSPYRNERDVKHHINQGINLSVFFTILIIITILLDKLLFANIFTDKIINEGTGSIRYIRNEMSNIVSNIIYGLVILINFIYAAIGINNVLKNKEKKLPIIGRFVIIRSKI